jgi:hypothetical protein
MNLVQISFQQSDEQIEVCGMPYLCAVLHTDKTIQFDRRGVEAKTVSHCVLFSTSTERIAISTRIWSSV